jgi:hypothetical protein
VCVCVFVILFLFANHRERGRVTVKGSYNYRGGETCVTGGSAEIRGALTA